mmetsp:Transcript_39678/g.112565  ORF Transcript_39678/g.112565 Transcript_39678/m.112565 type:complete len:252 (+) Transcript_39678:1164-1919(+)
MKSSPSSAPNKDRWWACAAASFGPPSTSSPTRSSSTANAWWPWRPRFSLSAKAGRSTGKSTLHASILCSDNRIPSTSMVSIFSSESKDSDGSTRMLYLTNLRGFPGIGGSLGARSSFETTNTSQSMEEYPRSERPTTPRRLFTPSEGTPSTCGCASAATAMPSSCFSIHSASPRPLSGSSFARRRCTALSGDRWSSMAPLACRARSISSAALALAEGPAVRPLATGTGDHTPRNTLKGSLLELRQKRGSSK